MESGLAFGGDDATAGPSRVVTLEYEQILRDPGLEEDRVELPQIDLHEDPRAATLAGIGPRRTRAPYPITGPAPVTVEPVRYVAAGRHSGTVLAEQRGWTAARQSQAGRRPGVTVAPSWEAVS
jgi:hypothetical protein